MSQNGLLKRIRQLARQYRVTDGKSFRLKDFKPGDTAGLKQEHKPHAKDALEEGIKTLVAQQEMLYAQDRWAVLLIFQAMDAAGKDGAIKHVMSGVNPQGCQVFSFKAPTSEELDHDYMWRCMKCLPERGRIGIFNRSYYEEALVVRVHPELLEHQSIPKQLVTKQIWKERLQDMRHFEQYLSRNGTVVRKFFLNVSKKEQLRRLVSRLDEPDKNWKFSETDVEERQYWGDYQDAYEDAIRRTATESAPWYVVPADNKWFTRIVVAAVVIETLASLNLHFPKVDDARKDELARIRADMLATDSADE